MKTKSFFKSALASIIVMLMLLSMVPAMSVSAATTEVAQVSGTTADGLVYSISNNKVTITDYTEYGFELSIPATIEGYPVTAIGEWAFYNCTSLENITIPASVTSIGEYAFRNCTSLVSITIPQGVTSIYKGTFESCKALESITIPESVTSIGDFAFFNCYRINYYKKDKAGVYFGGTISQWNTINFGEYNVYLQWAIIQCSDGVIKDNASPAGGDGDDSFGDYDYTESCVINTYYNNQITTSIQLIYYAGTDTDVVIPKRIRGSLPTSLGKAIYKNHTTLKSIVIPGSIRNIGEDAFAGCTSLIEVYFTGTQAEWNAITIAAGNEYLTNATIHFTEPEGGNFKGFQYDIADGMVTIIRYTGSGTDIVIPSEIKGYPVTAIGGWAFDNCSSPENITIPASVTSIGEYAFSYCTSLVSITIPQGVTSIGKGVFGSCKTLESITIPASVTSIGESAFWNCTSLENITISASVTSIGRSAFMYCSELANVHYDGTQEQWDAITIDVGNDYLENAALYTKDDFGAEIAGCSVTLGGELGVNFFLNFTDDTLADNAAKVIFSWNGNTVEIPVSEGINTENGYKFSVDIPAKDIGTDIVCKATNPLNESEEFTYSVKDYAEAILANPAVYGRKAVALVKSMLNYGAAAQTYFGYNTDSLANNTTYMTDKDRTVAVKDYSDYGYLISEGKGDVRYHGASLLLEEETSIKLHFILAEGVDADSLTVTVDGKASELKENGPYHTLTIPDIAAHELYDLYLIKVGDVNMEYGVFDYAALAQEKGKESLLNVMYALSAYADAAQAYIG